MVDRRTPKKISGLAGVLIAGLVLASCTESNGTPSPQPTPGPPSVTTASSAPPSPSTAESSATSSTSPSRSNDDNSALLEAGRTAIAAVDGSTLISIETENSGQLWEVELVTSDGTEHQLTITADGTKINSGPTTKNEGKDDQAEHRDLTRRAKLDYREAVTTIEGELAGKITELNLDSEGTSVVWEADVIDSSGTKHEITLDATNGEMIKKN